MAYQSIARGSVPNDGNGDDLRTGAGKINDNFVEVYTLLGNGSSLTSDTVVFNNTNNVLTNKTIDSGNNTITIDLSDIGTTFTGTISEFNSSLSDDNFASLSGSETLTNKTISAADNTLTISLNDLSDMPSGTTNQILSTNGAGVYSFVDYNPGLENIIEDSSPQLGGNLDTNSHTIFSTTGDIVFSPNVDVDFGTNIIKFSNTVSQESDLSNYSPSTYEGMLMHVSGTGSLYYVNNGSWTKVLTDVSESPVENYTSPSPTLSFETNTADGSTYKFTGPGIVSSESNPRFYVYRGHTYIWDNRNYNTSHPLQIRVQSGGNAFTEGVTEPVTGVTKFVVPMNPSDTSLVYQCTVHSAMVGIITII